MFWPSHLKIKILITLQKTSAVSHFCKLEIVPKQRSQSNLFLLATV